MKNIQIDDLDFELFIAHERIKERIQLMAASINAEYSDKQPVFIGVLNGCFMFMADLMKRVHIPCEVSFVKLASYNGTAQEHVSELLGVGMDLTGRDIIVVEDIVDSGNSLKHIIEALDKLRVARIAVCTLLRKPECMQHTFDHVMHVGFEIDKEFVVGYGLDYNGQCRNLPDIYRVLEIRD